MVADDDETIGDGLRIVRCAHYARVGLIARARTLETRNALARVAGLLGEHRKDWRLFCALFR